MTTKLTIELVPKTAWFSNVRSMVSAKNWDILKKESYKKASHKCEICNGVGKKHPVECHEIWGYDDDKYIQKLLGLISLCPSCHEVKHMGLANIRGRTEIAIKHLAKVNDWGIKQANEYVIEQFTVWEERSLNDWDINLSWLTERGIEYKDDRKS